MLYSSPAAHGLYNYIISISLIQRIMEAYEREDRTRMDKYIAVKIKNYTEKTYEDAILYLEGKWR